MLAIQARAFPATLPTALRTAVSHRVRCMARLRPAASHLPNSQCRAHSDLSSKSQPPRQTQSPAEAHHIVNSVFNHTIAATAAPISPLPPPLPTIPRLSSDVRLKVKEPFYPLENRADWKLLPFAQRNDYEGVFAHLEQLERTRLLQAESEAALDRARQKHEARTKGLPEPVFEEELPEEQLSKKARKRLKHRITSTSPALTILATLPHTVWFSLFQTFASLGRLEALDYFARRLEQLGKGIDEELVEVWMEGIIVACIAHRQAKAAEKLGAKSTAEQVHITGDTRAGQQQQKPDMQEASIASSASSSSSPSPSFSSIESHSPISPLPASPFSSSIGLPPSGLAWSHVTSLLVMMKRRSLLPSFRFVRSAFEAFALDNDVHGGLAFVTEIFKMKYYVSGFTYALFIQALSKHQSSAQACMYVFLHMEKARFAPHAQTFNALIQSFAEVGDYQTAYRLMQDMQKAKLYPDSLTFAAILEACIKGGKLDLAEQMWEYLKKNRGEMKQVKQVRITPNPNATQMNPSASSGAPASSSPDSLNIKLLPTASRPQVSSSLIPLSLGAEPYHILIQEYCRDERKEIGKAMELMKEMRAANIVPLLRTYHTLLKYMRKQQEYSKMKELWKEMTALGVEKKCSTWNTYVSVMKDYQEAKSLVLNGMLQLDKQSPPSSSSDSHSQGSTTIIGSNHPIIHPDAVTFKMLFQLLLRSAYISKESSATPAAASSSGDSDPTATSSSDSASLLTPSLSILDELRFLYSLMESEKVPPIPEIIQFTSRIIHERVGRAKEATLFRLSVQAFTVTCITPEFLSKLCLGGREELEKEWKKLRAKIGAEPRKMGKNGGTNDEKGKKKQLKETGGWQSRWSKGESEESNSASAQ